MAVQRGPTLSYAEATGSGAYSPAAQAQAEDDGVNDGRDFAAKKAEEDAAEPDAATKRHAWAAKSKEDQIKSGQTTQKVGTGMAATAGSILTAGGAICGLAALAVPPFTTIAAGFAFAVVLIVAAVVALAGGIVAAVGKGQVDKATGEQNAHLDDVSKGVNDAASAGEKAKMLNEKNRIAADRQKLGDEAGNGGIRKDIKNQKEYMATLDPKSEPKKYARAQKDLDRMTRYEGELDSRIKAYEKKATPSPTGEKTQGALGDAPPPGADAPLAMDAKSAAGDEGVGGTGTGATDVASSSSTTTTTTTNTGTSAPAATAPPPG